MSNFIGMNRATGKAITGLEHIRQSIADILFTRIGSRVMRRNYGSFIPDLIDQPINDATILRLAAASVMAIQKWEPRVKITRAKVDLATDQKGSLILDLSIERLDTATQSTEHLSIGLR